LKFYKALTTLKVFDIIIIIISIFITISPILIHYVIK